VRWSTHIPNPASGDVLPIAPTTAEEAFAMAVTVYGNEEFSDHSTIYWYDWLTPMGHAMQIVPNANLLPQHFDTFVQRKDIEHSDHIIDFGKPYLYYDIPQWTGSDADQAKYGPDHTAWPIYHVVFTYDQPYFYYARTRQSVGGDVPKSYAVAKMRSPIAMEIKERYAEQVLQKNNVGLA
jgi:hypothetical protein